MIKRKVHDGLLCLRKDAVLDGATIAGWTLDARAVRGFGPVAEIQLKASLLRLGMVVTGDSGEGAKEEVTGIGHDGGAARSDPVTGLKLVEFSERMVDVDGGAEFLDVCPTGK
ncbi:MAG TPA: hypothetical protein VJO16_04360 [Candidatus Acidoferrum sp.]|nr:hypothetical protein [Candidatus Acidoferrum sp.]